MASLHVLAKEDVQRICSGQSVVDLATAVKELVENAIDAGATQIDVKLTEYGRDALEVSDNGSGVAEGNYDTLVKKHFTSKISRFEDIAAVRSFGFRGEALSSICQLASKFSVCTRTKDEEIGVVLEYDTSGSLVSQAKKARPIGTTIMVEELFKPLIVRQKDFHKNIKKHYAKLLKVLQAYAVSCVSVKICVWNSTGKSSRQIVLSTQAHHGMGDNIANVFGTKFFRTLIPVAFDLNEAWQFKQEKLMSSQDESLDEDRNGFDDEDQDEIKAQERRVVGFVSKVGEGVGRSDNDRQFFFINGRPFDLPKIGKAVNEVWRQFEMKQKPACVLDFRLPHGEYDVNVTPDKRETFIKHEPELVEAFKVLLNKLYEPSRGSFLVQPLLSTFTRSNKSAEKPVEKSNALVSNDTNEPPNKPDETMPEVTATPTKEVSATAVDLSATQCTPTQTDTEKTPQHQRFSTLAFAEERAVLISGRSPRSCISDNSVSVESSVKTALNIDRSRPSSIPDESHVIVQKKRKKLSLDSNRGTPRSVKEESEPKDWSFEEMLEQRKRFFAEEDSQETNRKRTRLHVPKACSATSEDAPQTDNEVAAAALQRVLKKDDFKRMEVLGQFNLGFIIGKLDDDMFIIDQHASDEKFNYETLQQTTILHQQPLVRPLPLELTAAEEMVIMDHLPIFAKNGFTFRVDHSAPSTRKLMLLSLPFTKHTQFGVEDIRELASLLMDSPLNASSIRLPKVMAMFASRACRSSIMIGTALHKEEMQRIVRNLAGLEQPWNCPHGRPTLRHLVDLSQIQSED